MFDKVRNFVNKTLGGMIGNEANYQVRRFALDWYKIGILTDADLQTIDDKIEALQEPEPPVDIVPDEPTEIVPDPEELV